MPKPLIPLSLLIMSFSLAGCDTGPTGHGTAPPGVSQAEWDQQVAAQRSARRSHFYGPRGGASGR